MITNAIQNKDSGETISLLHDLLAGITYYQHESSESRYHSILHAAFLVAGLEVLSEVTGSDGRSDMTVFLKDMVRVVIELKCLKADNTKDKGDEDRETLELASALDDAENQIRVNDYAGPHRAAGCKVICLALAIRGRNEVAARFFDPE
ncbi:MAG: PD-(D/E)XK nuclease domain-containing protein [Deltaproteobacteria bacterium]|nr:PD-(D/E)XK nuclease domain-containing protein [Deltaproteobacteria bacterium]